MAQEKLQGDQLKEMSFEELMETSTDDIQESLGFIPLPHCIAHIQVGKPSFEQTQNKKWRLCLPYKVVELLDVLEKDPESGEPMTDLAETFFGENGYPDQVRERKEFIYVQGGGMNYFLGTWKDILGGCTIQEIPEKLANMEFAVEITARKQRDNDSIQNQIKSVSETE